MRKDIDKEIATAEAHVRWLKAYKLAQEAIAATGRVVVRRFAPLPARVMSEDQIVKRSGFFDTEYTSPWSAATALTWRDH